MIMMNKALAALTLASVAAAPALAADPRVNIANESTATIISVQMSPVGEDWGRDLLGSYVMRAGYHLDLVSPSFGYGCRYDMRVTFANGVRMEVRDFDACAVETVTVYNYAFAFETTRNTVFTRRGTRYSA